jgi:hypothetical protein
MVGDVQGELSGSSRADGQTRCESGPHHDPSMGPTLRPGVRETVARIWPPGRLVLARRQDVHQDQGAVDLSVPRRRQPRADGRREFRLRQARRSATSPCLPERPNPFAPPNDPTGTGASRHSPGRAPPNGRSAQKLTSGRRPDWIRVHPPTSSSSSPCCRRASSTFRRDA